MVKIDSWKVIVMQLRLSLFICISILLVSCGKGDFVNTSEKIKVTIRIEDSLDIDQRYLLRVLSDGNQANDIAILPQDKSIITNKNNEVTTNLALNVPYTIYVYRTKSKTIDEYYLKPKSSSAKSSESTKDNPLYTVNITPTHDTKTIKIPLSK